MTRSARAKSATRRLAPRYLQRPDQRGHVESQGADGEEGPSEGAQPKKRLAPLADHDAASRELRLQGAPQQKLKRNPAKGEGLSNKDQPSQNDG
jgi:hypothetical protein